MRSPVTVACVQAEPAILDRDATLERVDALTAEAHAAGAELVLFPEAFIPGYPSNRWVRFLAAGADPAARATFARLMREAVEVPDAVASIRSSEVGQAVIAAARSRRPVDV